MKSRAVLAASLFVVLVGVGCGGKKAPSATGSGGRVGSGGSVGSGGGSATGGQTVAGSGGAGQAGADAGIDAAPHPFAEQVLAIAAEYQAWGRVDDEIRWAPALCREPLPGIARPSTSEDPTTHGQKLYSVFAKNRNAYPSGPHVGQIVVKESWVPEAVPTPDGGFNPTAVWDAGDHFYPYARSDGGVFRAAEKAGLYIMFRVEPVTAETDEGWVYATVSKDGAVSSAGRVESCMGCHEMATHERLFGVPRSPVVP